MRLGLVTQKVTRGDGQGRVNFEIARYAARCGWQVTLLTCGVEQELRELPNVTWAPMPWSERYTALAAELRFARHSGAWLHRRRGELDALHVNGFNTLAAGDINAAHFVHGAWIKSPVHIARLRRDAYGAYQWVYSAVNSRLERRAFQQARIVVAVSQRVRQELIGIGVPEQRIRVILNGVDLKEFHPDESQKQTAGRKALGLPPTVPLGLFVGDIRTPRKNLDSVLRAMTQVPDTHLAVVGATEGSPFPALAAQLRLDARVHFLGYRRDVAQLMRAADYFAFPSRYEACSLVLLEALASGLPVITAASAGGAEIVTPECGVVLDNPDDVKALTAALQEQVEDSKRRAQMGGAARQIAEQYGWERMAESYLHLYRELGTSIP